MLWPGYQMTDKYSFIALIGRPNVGKSTFFNRLTKSNKAITAATPGVTRDRHYGRVTWDDKSFMLIDTGGLLSDHRQKMNDLIQEQTWQAVSEADIILFMLDGRDGLLPEDYLIAQNLRSSAKKVYFVVNKVDSPEKEPLLLSPFYELGVDMLWPVSAEHGYGVRTFLADLVDNLPALHHAQMDLPDDTIAVACIGRPNVGKSSLINRLLKKNRMVVSAEGGTTRDSVDTLLTKDDKHYLLIDTAGIRRRGKVSEKLEKFSVMRALKGLTRCDIALVLVDAGDGITEQDTKIIGYCLERGRGCIILVNKWDLVKHDQKRRKWILDDIERATNFVGFAPVLTVSALTGGGIKRILPVVRDVFQQFGRQFATGRLNRILQAAVEAHSPPMVKGKRLKLYYTTQIGTKPPIFVIFANNPKGIHFSYYRYLVNQYRKGLELDNSPITIFLRQR